MDVRGHSAIQVCEFCGVIVEPDRDACPNSEDSRDPDHPLSLFVRRQDAVDAAVREVRQGRRGPVVASIEAAEACLEAAKAGLR